mgnify:CR=1 FL=1
MGKIKFKLFFQYLKSIRWGVLYWFFLMFFVSGIILNFKWLNVSKQAINFIKFIINILHHYIYLCFAFLFSYLMFFASYFQLLKHFVNFGKFLFCWIIWARLTWLLICDILLLFIYHIINFSIKLMQLLFKICKFLVHFFFLLLTWVNWIWYFLARFA